jgi:DNA modification methylase
VTIQLLTGDCRDVLPTLASNSVHCVVTSPPYYGLRDYSTGRWEGGDSDCDHLAVQPARGNASYTNGQGQAYASNLQSWGDRKASVVFRDTCGKCGARRIDRQIGLEATPDAYIATMVAVFREVRRVLRPDGTCWVNMGDSYASTPSGSFDKGGRGSGALEGGGFRANKAHSTIGHGAKPKDLLMMPARLALALQADGWWLRSDIIWAKPNPMPESCTDRPTSAHEHVFLLTRSARYCYDADAVREPCGDNNHGSPNVNPCAKNTVVRGDSGSLGKWTAEDDARGRNLRNVWTIATAPYAEAHFATYPPALVERCIRAGTSERGCCAACGAPWGRVTERESRQEQAQWTGAARGNGRIAGGGHVGRTGTWSVDTTTTGWSPSCQCNAETQPCTILDPFLGSGTTALVADRLQRHCVGIDLSTTYADLARNRVTDDCPLFTSWAPAEDPEDARMADLFAGDEYQRLPAVVPERRDAFRNSERYVNQGPAPSNGHAEAAE